MRAVIYARFSSNLQRDESIDDQVRICRERAVAEGWEVEEVYADYAISGSVRERPGLNSMLARVAAGGIDIIVSESIDRISRDQEDIAAIFKRTVFAGVRIITTSEGEIGELHIGLKGTMAALYRKDMADKIRRGLVGRALAGSNPGGKTYGYRRVAKLDENGELIRGLREIDPDEAEIVRRVYREYINGDSPVTICKRLNRDGIPSPTGGEWSNTTLLGNRRQSRGMLQNEIYAGRAIYNRTYRSTHPTTRKVVVRQNPREKWIRVDVPDLRIVSDAEWEAAEAYRNRYEGVRPEQQRRPKRLLSGLTFCGVCGGTYYHRGRERWVCSRYKLKGTCTNSRTVTTAEIERRVLHGFREKLLDPQLVSVFVKEWHEARAERSRDAAKTKAKLERQLAAADAKVKRLLSAVADGADEFVEIRDILREARAERDQLAAQIAEIDGPAVVTLHPGIADDYRRQVEHLSVALEGEGDARQVAFNTIRSLIDRVIVSPASGPRGTIIEFEGRLNAVLDLATGRTPDRLWHNEETAHARHPLRHMHGASPLKKVRV